MKHIKFQQNLLKMADARDGWKHKPCNLPWFETDDRIWICPGGVLCVGILKSQFYLDKEKIFKDSQPLTNGKKIIDFGRDANEAVDTHITMNVKVKGVKMTLHKFTAKDETIYVDEQLLKDFELDISHFTGTNTRNPLYVWEDDEIVGVVYPVNHKDGDSNA